MIDSPLVTRARALVTGALLLVASGVLAGAQTAQRRSTNARATPYGALFSARSPGVDPERNGPPWTRGGATSLRNAVLQVSATDTVVTISPGVTTNPWTTPVSPRFQVYNNDPYMQAWVQQSCSSSVITCATRTDRVLMNPGETRSDSVQLTVAQSVTAGDYYVWVRASTDTYNGFWQTVSVDSVRYHIKVRYTGPTADFLFAPDSTLWIYPGNGPASVLALKLSNLENATSKDFRLSGTCQGLSAQMSCGPSNTSLSGTIAAGATLNLSFTGSAPTGCCEGSVTVLALKGTTSGVWPYPFQVEQGDTMVIKVRVGSYYKARLNPRPAPRQIIPFQAVSDTFYAKLSSNNPSPGSWPYNLTANCGRFASTCTIRPASVTLGPTDSARVVLRYTTDSIVTTPNDMFVLAKFAATGATPTQIADNSDSLAIRINVTDNIAPTMTISAPRQDSILKTRDFTAVLSACDADGTVRTTTTTLNGVAVGPPMQAATVAGCRTARTANLPLQAQVGTNTLVATVNDGVRTTTLTRTFVYNPTTQSTPIVAAPYVQSVPLINSAWKDTFTVKNPGVVPATYTLSTACTNFAAGCTVLPTSMTVQPGATNQAIVSYSTPSTAGQTANVTLTASYTGLTGSTVTASANMSVLTSTGAVPTIAITPANGTHLTTSTANLTVTWCDANDAITTHNVTVDGVLLTDTFVSITQAGCASAGTSSWPTLAVKPGPQTIRAIARDAAGHNVSNGVVLYFDAAPSTLRPAVTPKTGIAYFPRSTQSSQLYTVQNPTIIPVSYTMGVNCGTFGGCITYRPTLSLAAGTSDTVRVFFTPTANPEETSSIKLIAQYVTPTAVTVADTGLVTASTPTLAMLYQPQVTPSDTIAYMPGSQACCGIGSIKVKNLGTDIAVYQMATTLASGFSWWSGAAIPSTLEVEPGQTLNVDFMVKTSIAEGASGKVTDTLSVTAPNGAKLVAGSKWTFTVRSESPKVSVTPKLGPAPMLVPPDAVNDRNFTIANTGNIPLALSYTASCSGYVVSCSIPGANPNGTLAVGAQKVVNVSFRTATTVGAYGPSGTVNLVATYSSTVTDTGKIAVQASGVLYHAVAVTPANVSITTPANTMIRQSWEVKNTGTVAATYKLRMACTSAAVLCRLTTPAGAQGDPTFATVVVDTGAAGKTTVQAEFTTIGVGTSGQVSLLAYDQADSLNANKSGVVAFTVGTPALLTVASRSLGLNGSVARDACLDLALGKGASYECGDLRVSYALPGVTTMNKPRQAALLYLSSHAHASTSIEADVTTGPGFYPTSITATLKIEKTLGVPVQTQVPNPITFTWDQNWPVGVPRRITVPLDGEAMQLATGVYKYFLQITPTTGSQQQPVSDSGWVTIVNRIDSPFGRGWWLQGYEHVYPLADGSRLWVGGDGSTRWFKKNVGSATTYSVQSPLARPETLEDSGSVGFTRPLPNGAFVKFYADGSHNFTQDAIGQKTVFGYGTSGSDLRSIDLPYPAGGNSRTYALTYVLDSTPTPTNRLNSIALQGPGLPSRYTNVIQNAGGWNTLIKYLADGDPEQTKVQFSYTSLGVPATTVEIFGVTGADNDSIRFAYDARKLRADSTLMGTTASSDIVHTYCPAETRGRSWCSTFPEVLVMTGTLIDGPRLAPIIDTTRFYLNRFGGPDTVVNALGQRTRYIRDAIFPLLAKSIIQPNGLTTNIAINPARGLPDTVTVLYPLGSANGGHAITSFTWHNTWNLPLTVKSPTNETSTFTYYSTWPGRITESDARGTTTYEYNQFRQVNKVLPPSNGSPADGTGIQLGYDATLANLATVTSRRGTVEQTVRDEFGQVKTQLLPTDGTGAKVQVVTTYFASGLPKKVVSTGPVLGSTPAESLTVEHTYTKSGLPLTLKRTFNDGASSVHSLPVTSWTYDAAGRRRSEDSNGSADTTTYDAAGNVTAVRPKPRPTAMGFNGTITMEYDVLNRLTKRIVPSVSFAAKNGDPNGIYDDMIPNGSYVNNYVDAGHPSTFFRVAYPRYSNGTNGGFVTPSDISVFTYDTVTNDMLTASNIDGRITRTYLPNGLINSETQQIRALDRSDSTTHAYTLQYTYDLSGRRRELVHPTQLSAGAARDRTSWTYNTTGQLESVTDVQGSRINFNYYDDGSLANVIHGDTSGIAETMTNDADGRMIANAVTSSHSSPNRWFVNGQSTVLRQDVLSYDLRDKLDSVWSYGGFKSTRGLGYSGLGYLVRSNLTTDTPLGVCCSKVFVGETFVNDGMGTVLGRYSSTSQIGPVPGGSSTDPLNNDHLIYRFDSYKRHVATVHQPGSTPLQTDSLVYDGAGNQEWASQSVVPPDPNRSHDERASYYGADGKLRADDHRTMVTSTSDYTSVFEDYRYDALGRRIWVRTRTWCRGSYVANGLCQTNRVRRTVWDGSSELYEIQMPDSSENDVAAVPRISPFNPSTVSTGPIEMTIDPNLLFGRVAYAQGLGVDAPVSIVRFGYVSSMDSHDTTNWNPKIYNAELRYSVFSILPLWNAQGQGDIGVLADGGRTACVFTSEATRTPNTNCIETFWPRSFTAYQNEIGYGTRTVWHGSLIEGKRDASGLLYRRNRQYNPATGRFTQEDPIGLAGGMNLYGYSGGDPVNYSDPFGLCPGVKTSDGTESTAPCELMQAVFSEASNNSAEQVGIAKAVINRATDVQPSHYFGFHNTGDYETDVRGQASTKDIQGRGNSQYHFAEQIVAGKVKLTSGSATGRKWQSVVDGAESAYTTNALSDPTNGAEFWTHNPKMVPKANCHPVTTTQVGSATFLACSQ